MVVWACIGVYFLVMAYIGITSYKRANSLSAFVVGNRQAGAWTTALGYGATYFSAVLFIGYAGKSGWIFALWAVLIGVGNAVIGSYLSWHVLAERTRRVTKELKITTMPQLFEKRYDSKFLKYFAAIVIFIFMVPYSASVYSGLSYLSESVLGINYEISMLLIAVICGTYVILGGYLASLRADFYQGLLIIFGVIAMIFFVVNSDVAGGLSNSINSLVDIMAEENLISLSSSQIISLVSLIILTSFGTWGLPQIIHKYYGLKDSSAIKKGKWISTMYAMLVSGGAYFVGAMAKLFLDAVPTVDGVENYDMIVPTVLSEALPSLLLGIVMVLVLSASVSTLAGITLTSCSTLSIDFIPAVFKSYFSDKKKVFFLTRALCLLFIISSYFIALTKSPILFLMSFSWGTIAGSFLAPYLLGLVWKGMNKGGAYFGMLGGFGFAIGFSLITGFDATYSSIIGVSAIGVSFILSAVGSLICRGIKYNGNSEVFFKNKEMQVEK